MLAMTTNSNPVSEVVPSLDWKTDYRRGQLKGNNTIIDRAPKAGKRKKSKPNEDYSETIRLNIFDYIFDDATGESQGYNIYREDEDNNGGGVTSLHSESNPC